MGIGLEMRPRMDSEPVLERTRVVGAFVGEAPLAGAAAFHGLFIVEIRRDAGGAQNWTPSLSLAMDTIATKCRSSRGLASIIVPVFRRMPSTEIRLVLSRLVCAEWEAESQP
jgi:hypothetical protein